jgi:hypothetical protein
LPYQQTIPKFTISREPEFVKFFRHKSVLSIRKINGFELIFPEHKAKDVQAYRIFGYLST